MNPLLKRALSALAAVAGACFIALTPVAAAPAQPNVVQVTHSPIIAIEHVNVLPMTQGGSALTDSTVVIRDGRIASIAPAAQAKVPSGARRVNAKGKWLMPALADMHVHLPNDRMLRIMLDPTLPYGTIDTQDILTPYVANGVLQVLNMAAMSESVGQRTDVETGRVLGPHIALAAMLDGVPPFWPPGFTRMAGTPEDGRQAVRDIKAEGYDFVKVYGALNVDTFLAIVDEAQKQKLRTLGHIPLKARDNIDAIFVPNYTMVAHAEEFAHLSHSMSDEEIAHFVELAKRNGTALTASLTLDDRILEQTRGGLATLKSRPELRYLHPGVAPVWFEMNRYVTRNSPERIAQLEKTVEFNRKLVKAFVQAGIPVFAGTDSLVPGVMPGFALHDELEAMSAAGMTNEQVLQSATRMAMEWLGVAADRGTVEAGKRADLLLLDADPLANVANTRKIAAVIAGDRYLTRSDLDAMLGKLTKRYATMPRPKPPARATSGSTGGSFDPDL